MLNVAKLLLYAAKTIVSCDLSVSFPMQCFFCHMSGSHCFILECIQQMRYGVMLYEFGLEFCCCVTLCGSGKDE